MDKIFVNKMEFYGYHGVFPEENKLGQRFIVDLTVLLDLQKAGQTDQLEYSVNYAELYRICKEIVEGEPVQLIETLAERIAAAIIKEFQAVSEVIVKVIKPDPPIPGHFQSVAIEITRRRE
jgi:dihydroneopterin aldolase